MPRLLSVCACLLLVGQAALCAEADPGKSVLEWGELPPLPEPLGFGGPFAGVSGGALIVAGGANFPTPLFEGGKKEWARSVFVLTPKNGKGLRGFTLLTPEANRWYRGAGLSRPLAYGASVTAEGKLICIGGCDASQCYATVFALWFDPSWVTSIWPKRVDFPDLPKPCAMMGAARIGNTIYVAGGQDSPTATEALKSLWALDLSQPPRRREWAKMEPFPGPGRILPVIAAQSNGEETQLYVISGAKLAPDAEGKAVRTYLTDGYAYSPKAKTWRQVADVPKPVVAAPAAALGQFHILVFGGDDGANAARVLELKDEHPGFSRDVLAYHTITDTWTKMGALPQGQVTTNAVEWDGRIVIPSGEVRPGVRTPKVYVATPKKHTASFGAANYAVLAVYLLVLVAMGVYFSKREKSTDDFFLAGRRIPWWAAGLSIYGTQLSAITFISIPATVYATNWVPILANACIVLVAPIVVFLYLPFYRRLHVTTAYEYLERRFNLGVRLLGSLLFVLFQLGRMGVVLFLPALALAAATGINVYVCIALMGVLCTVYTVLGGIEAVIWTDVLQVVVLLGGALVALIIIAGQVDGGFAGIFQTAAADGKLKAFNWTWDYTVMAVWVVVLGNLFANLMSYTTDQAVIQRYLTTRDERAAARSIWANAILCIPGSLLFFVVGTALYVYFKAHPGVLEPTLQNDATFPLFIAEKLPAGLTGLVIAGIFAASMSSLDSSMNSVATALVTDFYRRFRPAAADATCLALARWLTLALGVLGTGTALLLATYDIKSLWFAYAKILGLVGGGLTGVFALGILTRRATGLGALAGVLAGTLAGLYAWLRTPMHFYLYAAVGVVGCFVVGYLVSLAAPGGRRDLAGMTVYTMHARAESEG